MTKWGTRGGHIILMVALLASAGCSTRTDGESNTKTLDDTKPVTLSIVVQEAMSDADFNLMMVEPLKKKYPYITLKRIKIDNTTKLEDLLAANQVPDIVAYPQDMITYLSDLGLVNDMEALNKKHNVDLNRFEPAALDVFKMNGKVIALPYAQTFITLYVNHDIFDKFGVAHPKDGMTWDDAIALAEKVTRLENGIQYKGLEPSRTSRLSRSLALPYFDPKTGKSVIASNDAWKKVFLTTKAIYDIPGNTHTTGSLTTAGGAADQFYKNQTVAMIVSTNIMTMFDEAVYRSVNWDLVQTPSFPEAADLTRFMGSFALFVTKQSSYKDQAMKVIQTVISDEVQREMVRKTLRVSPLKNKDLQTQFGADIPHVKGKNTMALFKGKPIPWPSYMTEYDNDAANITESIFYKDMLVNGMDINTALREMDEKINKMAEEKQRMKK